MGLEMEHTSVKHNHVFGQDHLKAGERRTMIVIAITAVMMFVEIVAADCDPIGKLVAFRAVGV